MGESDEVAREPTTGKGSMRVPSKQSRRAAGSTCTKVMGRLTAAGQPLSQKELLRRFDRQELNRVAVGRPLLAYPS